MKAHRGLVLVLLSVLLPLAVLRCLPTGSIGGFSYQSGHAWSGFYHYEIHRTDSGFQAVYSYEPGMMFEDEESPWTVSVPLTDTQMAQFSDIVLRQLKLSLWPDLLMAPDAPTDMDGWSIQFSCGGRKYQKSGYACTPPRLKRIDRFFQSLDWAETIGPQHLAEAIQYRNTDILKG